MNNAHLTVYWGEELGRYGFGEDHPLGQDRLAAIGRRAGVASIYSRSFSGLIAWFLWLVVHITSLIGFRKRLVVLFEWSWAYLTYQRSARVILSQMR